MVKVKEKKLLVYIRVFSVICVIILCFELGYLIDNKYFNFGDSIYFDSINAIDSIDDGFVAVGSNNNNEMYYEKAKLSFYDEKYNKKLEKIYNKGYNSVFFDVESFENEVIAVGSFEKDNIEHEDEFRSALIVKYDYSGNIIFENSFSILDNSKFMAVDIYDDSYFVVGQSIYDELTLGNSSKGGAFLLKYDKDGNVVWKSNFGDNKSAIYNDLYVTDDYIFVVGYDFNNIGILAKYDHDGKLMDYVEYEFTDEFGFTSIKFFDDILFVSGGKKTHDEIDAVIVKYDIDCNYISEVTFDNDFNERFNKLILDNNDSLVAIGSISMYDKDKNNKDLNVLHYDGVIAKYKLDLQLIKSVCYGDDNDDHFTDILLSDNRYLVSGYSFYTDNSYMSKFVVYSDALKVLEVK